MEVGIAIGAIFGVWFAFNMTFGAGAIIGIVVFCAVFPVYIMLSTANDPSGGDDSKIKLFIAGLCLGVLVGWFGLGVLKLIF